MSNRTIQMTDALHDYVLNVSVREHPLLQELREETAADPMSIMQISPEQGQFMAMLTRLIGARRYLEVGVFTGYSSLSVGMALPEDGQIVACDVSEKWTGMARRYWDRAGLGERVALHLAPAAETLQKLLDEGQAGSFDFAFIDADKRNYKVYYEAALQLLRTGGLLAVDNVLWGGSVIDPENKDESTEAIRAFNAALTDDERVDINLIPIGDGLMLIRKR